MRRRIVLFLLTGASAALMVLPSAAFAAPRPASRRTAPLVEQEIGEQGSNGFYLTLSVHDRHQLELSVSKTNKDLLTQTVSYRMPYEATSAPDEIKANFGRLGRVDMRFDPEKHKEFKPPGSTCKGGKIREEEGFWLGIFAFHGEGGFTKVRVRSALGTVTKVPPLRCRAEKAADPKKLRREQEALEKSEEEAAEEESAAAKPQPQPFELVARDRRVAFVASRATLGKASISNLVVAASRQRGRIKETSSVFAIFAPGSYVRPVDSSKPTTETIVKPPAPFSGSATYRTPPRGRPTWLGDLKVELPGFGDVPLAGRGARATICEGIDAAQSCGQAVGGQASSLLERRR